MGGRNEQTYFTLINNNQSNDSLVRAVKVKTINSQVTTDGYNIDESEPGTIAANEIDKHAYTCCLGKNVTVL